MKVSNSQNLSRCQLDYYRLLVLGQVTRYQHFHTHCLRHFCVLSSRIEGFFSSFLVLPLFLESFQPGVLVVVSCHSRSLRLGVSCRPSSCINKKIFSYIWVIVMITSILSFVSSSALMNISCKKTFLYEKMFLQTYICL